MSGVITRGSNPKLQWEGINKVWGMWYNEYPQQWPELFEKSISGKAYEEDVGMSGFGLAPTKSEGSSTTFDVTKQTFITRYTNVAYSLAFAITFEEEQDNLYNEVAVARTRCLAKSVHQSMENVGANIFNRGFNTDPIYAGGDGVSLFNAAHPTEGGTFANVPVNSSGVLQGVDLSEATLENALIDIKEFRDERNLRVFIQGMKLAVPNQLEYVAERILGNPNRPATADRDINAMYHLGKLPKGFAVNTYFTDPNAWFVLTDCPNGFRYFERNAPIFRKDNDFDTYNDKYSVYARFSFGWTNPRAGWGSPGA